MLIKTVIFLNPNNNRTFVKNHNAIQFLSNEMEILHTYFFHLLDLCKRVCIQYRFSLFTTDQLVKYIFEKL